MMVFVDGRYSMRPKRSTVNFVRWSWTHTSVKLIRNSEASTVEGSRATPVIQVAGYELRGTTTHGFPSGSTTPLGRGRKRAGGWPLGRRSIGVPSAGISLRSVGTRPGWDGPTAAVDPMTSVA